MNKKAIFTKAAPEALGAYSQAIVANGLVFTAGQVGIDPAVGGLVSGNISDQAEQVLKNLEAILEAGGSSFENVVKTTIYLTDISDFAAVNEKYGLRFKPSENPPARSTVEVAALPIGAKVEIEMVAVTNIANEVKNG